MSLRHTQGNGFQLSNSVCKGSDIYWKNYMRDGSGRDDYIALNNGGLNKTPYSPSKGISSGSQMYVGRNQNGPRTDIFPSIPGKTINYNYNGSGRDSYIASSNGGFYPSLGVAEYTKNFEAQLRISHSNTREPTEDYQNRRDLRMGQLYRN